MDRALIVSSSIASSDTWPPISAANSLAAETKPVALSAKSNKVCPCSGFGVSSVSVVVGISVTVLSALLIKRVFPVFSLTSISTTPSVKFAARAGSTPCLTSDSIF